MMKSEPTARRVRRTSSAAKAHAVLERTAPFIATLVGARGEELREEVALGPHELDAVVAGLARELRRDYEIGQRAFDLGGGHLAGRMHIDRRFERGGRDDAAVIAVAARMQQLQDDPAACLVHGARNDAVRFGVVTRRELRAVLAQVSGSVGREAAGHDERRAAARPLGVEGGQALRPVGPGLELRVHRAHHDAVGQNDESEIERPKEVREGGHRGAGFG
jgi:hypothetical protein